MNRAIYLVIAAAVAVVVILASVYVVNEKEKALVLQFGQIRQVIEEPGKTHPVLQGGIAALLNNRTICHRI